MKKSFWGERSPTIPKFSASGHFTPDTGVIFHIRQQNKQRASIIYPKNDNKTTTPDATDKKVIVLKNIDTFSPHVNFLTYANK